MPKLLPQLRAGLGAPPVSGYYLPAAELVRRASRAERLAEAQAADLYPPGPARRASATYHGRSLLWHEEFATGLRVYLADADLYKLTVLLAGELPTMNGGQPLDYHDYGYLADVLRELLADRPRDRELLLYSRALAWVESEGEKIGGE